MSQEFGWRLQPEVFWVRTGWDELVVVGTRGDAGSVDNDDDVMI